MPKPSIKILFYLTPSQHEQLLKWAGYWYRLSMSWTGVEEGVLGRALLTLKTALEPKEKV